MATLKFKQHIEDLFKKSTAFSDGDGNLDVNAILEAIDKIDSELIKILKNDEKAKERFFIQVEDMFVLEQNKLIEFFLQNDYMKNSSYTSYTNKIGLIRKDNFIKKFDDVVLAWPHKDCVLEGGQTKDDEKNGETFYNEILSSDEIERLFEPKALTSIKRYTIDGVEENPSIKENDNLIIKGNNLLVLHSLKVKYTGKVKLIYIDPPYNTGNDSFKYNDNFNHSTWLTFMKNRLEVAREFLSDDGVIFVQCDYNEDSYLKVLMDEIFSIDNFIANISVKSSTPSGTKTAHKEKKIIKQKDTILVYKRNECLLKPQYIYKDYWDNHYSYYFNPNEALELLSLRDVLKEKGFSDNEIFDVKNKKFKKFYLEHAKYIVRRTSHKNLMITTKCQEKPNSILEFDENYYINKDMIQPLSRSINDVFVDGSTIKKDLSILACDFWGDIDFQNTQNEGGVSLTSGKKPESLLYRIINMVTEPNDLVMDFHLGSGTTCAVAHKMGRRYIGIEQMDYIEDIAVERMKKVIAGEQGGISKSVEWGGGGSFVYAELREIENFKNTEIGKLNKTMKYLPISEIEDAEYGVCEEEIAINKAFYGLENE